MHKMQPRNLGAARPLVADLPHYLSVHAVLDGTCPGEAYVDDPADPQATFVVTPEGHYVIGRPDGEAFLAWLSGHVRGKLAAGRAAGWRYACFRFSPDGWREPLGRILAPFAPTADYQNYLVCRKARPDWREGVPAGFEMRPIDRALLDEAGLANHGRVAGWAKGNFGSAEGFLAHGFGFCLLHGQAIASWCLADCVSGERCEIGIHTAPGFRRRGLATLTAAAAVEHALSRGLTRIGWHCWSANVASAATAHEVGFKKELEHPGFVMVFGGR